MFNFHSLLSKEIHITIVEDAVVSFSSSHTPYLGGFHMVPLLLLSGSTPRSHNSFQPQTLADLTCHKKYFLLVTLSARVGGGFR